MSPAMSTLGPHGAQPRRPRGLLHGVTPTGDDTEPVVQAPPCPQMGTRAPALALLALGTEGGGAGGPGTAGRFPASTVRTLRVVTQRPLGGTVPSA